MNYPFVKILSSFQQKYKVVFLLLLGVSLHLFVFAQPEPDSADAAQAAKGPKIGPLDTRLSTIYYPAGKISLDESAKEELDYVIKLFQMNPELVLSVQGHSDDQGSISRHNYLSKYRAWLAWAYLVSHGIPHHQITHYGFGYRKPKIAGIDKKARQENRRVEIHVILPRKIEEEPTAAEEPKEK